MRVLMGSSFLLRGPGGFREEMTHSRDRESSQCSLCAWTVVAVVSVVAVAAARKADSLAGVAWYQTCYPNVQEWRQEDPENQASLSYKRPSTKEDI